MISEFKGPYSYAEKIVREWNSSVPGVYYLGVKTPQNQMIIYYIGKAVAEGGIRSRLLEHLSENKWDDVTHFGYHASQPLDVKAVNELEEEEIKKYSPKYNTVWA